MLQRRQFFGTLAALAAAAPRLPAFGGVEPGPRGNLAPENWHCHTIQTVARDGFQQPPVVTGVALQPKGQWLAVVGDDHVVSLLDLSRHEFVGHFVRHFDWVRAARFTQDGGALLTAGHDGRLLAWDVSTVGEARELARHDAAILALAVSHGGQQVAAVGFEPTVTVYDLATGRLEHRLRGPCDDLSAVAYSADDALLAAAGRCGTIRVWKLGDDSVAAEFRIFRRRVRSLEFLADGRLAACGDDCEVALVDPRNPTATERIPRFPGKLFAIRWLEPNLLAVAGSDNRIHIWDLAAAKNLETLSGHTGTVTCLDCQAGTLVSGSYDTQIRIWESQRQALAPTAPETSQPKSIWK